MTVHHIVKFSLGSKFGKVRNVVFFTESVQDHLELLGRPVFVKEKKTGRRGRRPIKSHLVIVLALKSSTIFKNCFVKTRPDVD